MRNHRLGVAGQLEREAERVAAAESSTVDRVRREVAEAWRHRLENLSDSYLASELDEAAEKLLGCLPQTAQSWIDASRNVSSEAPPEHNRKPELEPTHPPIPHQVAAADSAKPAG